MRKDQRKESWPTVKREEVPVSGRAPADLPDPLSARFMLKCVDLATLTNSETGRRAPESPPCSGPLMDHPPTNCAREAIHTRVYLRVREAIYTRVHLRVLGGIYTRVYLRV